MTQRSESAFSGFRVVTYTPENPQGTLVWFHGGGWMIGLGEDSELWGRDLAERTAMTVVLPDYPLAREFAYPKSNGWCTAFWQETTRTAPRPLVLGGDSAGAHLALCSLPAAMPDKAIFVYPVTTLLPTRDSGSWKAYTKGWPLSPRLMDYFYDAYCPDMAARYGASPLEQLGRIPETLIITAGRDILADQQNAFVYRFGATQIVYPEATHIFLSREDGIEHRTKALDDIAAWLRSH